jgi:predicted ester cyclase
VVKALGGSAILKTGKRLVDFERREMDVQALAQDIIDMFNERSFREKAKDLIVPEAVIVDNATGQELYGPEGYVRFSEELLRAVPDLKGTVSELRVSGNNVITRLQAQGRFTGTLQTPQGSFPGNEHLVDVEYQIQQIFNDAEKLVRVVIHYDRQELMRQLGV